MDFIFLTIAIITQNYNKTGMIIKNTTICLIFLLLNVVLGQKIVDIYDTMIVKARNDTRL